MTKEIATTREQVAEVKSDLQKEIAEVKSDLKNDIAQLDNKLTKEISAIKHDILKWMIPLIFTVIAFVAGIAVKLFI